MPDHTPVNVSEGKQVVSDNSRVEQSKYTDTPTKICMHAHLVSSRGNCAWVYTEISPMYTCSLSPTHISSLTYASSGMSLCSDSRRLHKVSNVHPVSCTKPKPIYKMSFCAEVERSGQIRFAVHLKNATLVTQVSDRTAIGVQNTIRIVIYRFSPSGPSNAISSSDTCKACAQDTTCEGILARTGFTRGTSSRLNRFKSYGDSCVYIRGNHP
eukprot:6640947-Pyramimonas_sp.AAC.2